MFMLVLGVVVGWMWPPEEGARGLPHWHKNRESGMHAGGHQAAPVLAFLIPNVRVSRGLQVPLVTKAQIDGVAGGLLGAYGEVLVLDERAGSTSLVTHFLNFLAAGLSLRRMSA